MSRPRLEPDEPRQVAEMFVSAEPAIADEVGESQPSVEELLATWQAIWRLQARNVAWAVAGGAKCKECP
jgi:hypothetical protein